MNEYFRQLAQHTSNAAGSSGAFGTALVLVLVWLLLGPIFHYSDTWQLLINTATTIVTFLMVFLIQNTQNRDSRVIHLKLDELLRAIDTARTAFADLENLSDEEIKKIQEEFQHLSEKYGESISPLSRALRERTLHVADRRAKKTRRHTADQRSI